jgi:hypothetical protein
MFRNRIHLAALVAVLVSALFTAPALGAEPIGGPTAAGPAPTPIAEPPLTPEQKAASDRKIAAANAYLARANASGLDMVTLSCVSPTSTAGTAPSSTTSGVGGVSTQACAVPQGFLGVEARDQIFGHYCGPAVGQVIANYAWAMAPGRDKYSQLKIAGWMRTDQMGGTSSQDLANGLEVATRGAPRRPAIWTWVVSPLADNDRDGHVGDELHGFIRANVSGSKMPLAFSLKPFDRFGRFHLSSWARPVNSPGHWIAGYGWVNNYSNVAMDQARTYYTDSSRDEGGSTGKFWDPTRHIAEMIMVHTRVFVW